MKRREFFGLLGGVAALPAVWPSAGRAQPSERLPRIGYVTFASAVLSRRVDDAFWDGLRDLGYVEGRNFRAEYRSAEGDGSRVPALLAELVDMKVDVIVTYASAVAVAMRATKTIPIVMAVGPDLVALGLAETLAHPGGNATGSTFFVAELMSKRLELLKEIAPAISGAGVLLFRSEDNSNANTLEGMRATAEALKVKLHPMEVRGPDELEGAFAAWGAAAAGGFVMNEHAILTYNADKIAQLAAKQRLLSAGPLALPENGGLIGYGVDFPAIFRRAGYFVDRILKGTKPGDIPIEQATKFRTMVNLKTAKLLGLELSPTLLARADEVIE